MTLDLGDTREIEKVFAKLTLSDDLMAKIGPAVNSGQSIMLYGPAGNGKSSIAIAVTQAYEDNVYLPYCFEVDNQVITLYDQTVHHRLDKDHYGTEGLRRGGGSLDKRYVLCQRPAVIAGGELTLEALNLAYNPTSRIYEAPMQLKAVGGVLVIDDFGRQRHTPQEMINRLIIPLEVKVDYLTLQTGRKFEVPFDPVVIFSTSDFDAYAEVDGMPFAHAVTLDIGAGETHAEITLRKVQLNPELSPDIFRLRAPAVPAAAVKEGG